MKAPITIDAMAPRRPSIARALVLALAIPALLSAVSYWLGSEYAATEKMRLLTQASFDRRLEAGTLIGRIADAESSQRGFVITGDPVYLADYAPAQTDVAKTFGKLRRELAREPAQAMLLARLSDLAREKFREMDQVIAARRTTGLPEATRLVGVGRGRRLMDEMRGVSARILALATIERDARVEAYRERVDADRGVMWIGIAAAGLVLLSAAVLIWRQSTARYRARLAAYSIAERNRSILDSTIDAIAILNPSGTIETINAAASSMLGYTQDELERRDISVLINLLDRPVTFHERIGLVDGRLANPYLPDRRILHRDGHEIPADIALGVMRLPDGDYIVASVRDISERKRIDRMKDELMSTVSHELRTPLTSVVGALGLLRAGSAGALPAPAARLIEIAENNSRRLIRLINDMLDIDRIQSGRLHLDRQSIDLRDTVGHACEGSRGIADSAGVRIECDLPDAAVMVTGDADRLLQVITNLVSNAVRASPPAGVVTIGLAPTGGRAVVSVDDEGQGVPAEFRDRIFGRFERAEGEQGVGTGLGLAISREIIGRHDGSIWFEDRESGGTRFAFVLDQIREQPAASEPAEVSRILICEDDADIAETLRQMVEAMGHCAHCVGTAAAAFAALATEHYAALLLDLRLPDENGLSLAQSIRATDSGKTLPIIIVSALTRNGIAEQVPMDIIDWIEKPVDPARLAAALGQAIGRSGVARPTVLHVDDDHDMLDVVASALSPEARVFKSSNLASARKILQSESPDVVILDLHLEEGSGLELLPLLTDAQGLAIPTIVFSAHDISPADADQVDAVLVKSRGSLPDLQATVRRILDEKNRSAA